MSEEPPADEPRLERLQSARGAFDAVPAFGAETYLKADRALDYGQAYAFRLLWLFLPEPAIFRERRFEHIFVSRFLSDAGQQALAYGALIAVVREGGSAFEAALVGIATVLPPALFGLHGGVVADSLPKRMALAAIYNLQAILCFIFPAILGTELIAVLALIFAVNALGQVSGPSESAVLPMVVSERQLATAASLINLASTIGTAFGTAVLAPIIVRAFGVEPVMYLSGTLLMLAASRVFDLSTQENHRPIGFRQTTASIRPTLNWLLSQRAVAAIMLLGIMAGTVNIVIQTLAPRYVQSILGVDAADTVYVFAPSVGGLLLALALSPLLIRLFGERLTSLVGFSLAAAALLLLGIVGHITGALNPINPVRLINLIGFDLEERLRTAALIAFPLGFGLTLATTSIQTFINRRIPLAYQGRAFALQSSLKNGAAVVPLATLGAAASAFGVDKVLVAAPFALLILAYIVVQASFRFARLATPSSLEVLGSFWERADTDIDAPASEAREDGKPSEAN